MLRYFQYIQSNEIQKYNVYYTERNFQTATRYFSYILTYMIHTWLQFTLNMEKSIKQKLSKFHFHKLKLTCSFDRLYKGTIAFHFRTDAKFEFIA